jgi:5-methylcytosine-specific restriction endonuclease McrA
MALQGYRCANPYCDVDLRYEPTPYHWDHIKPKSRGGSDSLLNGQYLCEPCNLSKRAQSWPTFLDRYARSQGLWPNNDAWNRWKATRAKVGGL